MAYERIDKQDVEKLLKSLSGKGPLITVAAGAANVCTFTIQFAVKAVHAFDMYMSTDSGGANVSATTYSTGLAATTGAVAASITANKILKVLTDATGKAVITLTATGKPATEYLCIPRGFGMLAISPVSGTNFG